MKIRSHHIFILIMLFVGVFVALIFVRQADGPTRSAGTGEDAFIQELENIQQTTTSDSEAGLLPPVGADTSQVPNIDVVRVFDAGTIANNDIHHTALKIANTGKTPLRISTIQTSCVCTLAHIPADGLVIAPGTASDVEVTIDPKRIPGFHSNKTLTITSNDPDNTQVAVDVTAKVDPEFEVLPAKIDFGTFAKGELPEAKVRVRQLLDTPLELTAVTTPPPTPEQPFSMFEGTVQKLAESTWQQPGKAEYEVTVRPTDKLSTGPFDLYVLLNNNTVRVPKFVLDVVGAIAAPYTVTPASPAKLMLRAPEGSPEPPNAELVISSSNPVDIENLQVDATKLTAEILPDENPTEVRVRVSVAPGAPQGVMEAPVVFTVVQGQTRNPESISARTYVAGESETPPAAPHVHDESVPHTH